MREIRTSGSVGGPAGQLAGSTRLSKHRVEPHILIAIEKSFLYQGDGRQLELRGSGPRKRLSPKLFPSETGGRWSRTSR